MAGMFTEMRYPDSKNKYAVEQAMEFQDYVMDVLLKKMGIVVQIYSSRRYQIDDGESIQGFEIKLDNLHSKTKQLSIELYEKRVRSNKDWIPSGILRNDNTIFYIQGNFDDFYIFSKKHLVSHFNETKPDVKDKETIKTFYLKKEVAENLCVWHFVKETKMEKGLIYAK